MKAIIAGAGRLGARIADVLAPGNDLTVVDVDDARLAELTPRLAARMVRGDATEPGVLEEAGAFGAELLIAATARDQDNLVISLLAKRRFDVPRVVARVNDADNAWLFDAHWGVDVAVPATTPLLSLVEEATGASDTVALLRLSRAGVSVIESTIAATSHAAGCAVSGVRLPPGTLVAAVIRDGTPILPDQDLPLEAGDEVLVVSTSATEADVRAAFQ